MCPIFYESFCGAFFKKRLIASPRLLLARFLNRHSHSHGHTNHGVVTSADESHHLYASGALAIASGEKLPPKSLAT